VFHIDCQIALGEIFNMTERSFDYELLTQVFVDGFRLRRRFHDYQSLWHRENSHYGTIAAPLMIAVYPENVTTL
jgi:hypothetical protein